MKLIRLSLGLLALASLSACFRPANSLDYYLEGQLKAERGQLDSALDSLSRAIEKNPQLGLALVARGEVYKQKGDYLKAATDFEQATKIEPFNFNANYQLGLMYQYLNRYSDAVRIYQKAVEIRPLDPDANMNLAIVYVQLGEPLRGLPYAQRAVDGNPDYANARANLGILYVRLGQNDMAIDELKRAIELNSKQPEVYLNLAQEYLRRGKFEQAKNVLVTARDLAPSPAISERLGLAWYKLKDLPQARDAFNDALRQNPNYYQALNGLGVIAMSQSLATDPPDMTLAHEALAYWDRSLKIEINQPVIQQLMNKYSSNK
jgi:tetratricopeptide (TPR) repeat protein